MDSLVFEGKKKKYIFGLRWWCDLTNVSSVMLTAGELHPGEHAFRDGGDAEECH